MRKKKKKKKEKKKKKQPTSEQARSRHVLGTGTSVPAACVLKGTDSKSFKPSSEDLSQLNQSGW